MSPSRIPRPGGIGSPTITSSPLSQSSHATTRPAPALGTIVHHSKNPFAQLHNSKQQHQYSQHGSPTPSIGSTNTNYSGTGVKVLQAPANASGKRRIKPPSPPDMSDDPIYTAQPSRRPPPADSKSRIPSNGRPSMAAGQGQRTILRQPSTPALITVQRSPVPPGRPRALSSTLVSRPVIVNVNLKSGSGSGSASPNHNHNPQEGVVIIPKEGLMRSLPSQKLFESSFLESREPAVPPHIRVRLKLIHQLGVVLGIDAVGISGKIDIPGLLARVDQAYERDKERATSNSGLGSGNGNGNGNGNVEVALKGSIPGGNPGKGVLGILKRLGGTGSSSTKKGEDVQGGSQGVPQEGPAFGVPLSEAPPGSWCTSLIGGQKHELPLVVFTIVEEIYRRGMSQPGIFRLAGNGIRISHLTKVYNLPPLYGDSLPINQEPIHNLTGLVKRYVRDLPEPILDESLFPAFLAFCVGKDEDSSSSASSSVAIGKDTGREGEGETQSLLSNDELTSTQEEAHSTSLSSDLDKLPLETRITAAQILLKLLPPLQFSLFIYLLAFLGQLPLFPDNRLNVESISIIFGPAMCAARGKGISGLGPTVSSATFGDGRRGNTTTGQGHSPKVFDPDKISDLVSKSQNVLSWLLRNWASISEKVLEDDDSLIPPTPSPQEESKEKEKRSKKEKTIIDPRLLSPIDLRGSNDGMRATRKPTHQETGNADRTSPQTSPVIPSPKEEVRKDKAGSPVSPEIQTPHTTTHMGMGLRKSASSHTLKMSSSGGGMKPSMSTASGFGFGGMKTSPSSGGLFARALSSMSISSQAGTDERMPAESGVVGTKGPKRSASFTSLSSLVKKVGKDHKHVPPLPGRSMSDDRENAHSSVNPQITTVLGSLHDLLVSKDKQIERDARELGLLRHTLLEMDEKLQRATLASPLPGPVGINGCTCPIHPNATMTTGGGIGTKDGGGVMPEIKITSTPSSSTLPSSVSYNEKDRESLNKEIGELQGQLRTALAGLETSRLNLHKQNEKILLLEAKNSRMDSERKLEVSKLQVALALEQARCVGLIEERDLARERLEKVKTTLFSVA